MTILKVPLLNSGFIEIDQGMIKGNPDVNSYLQRFELEKIGIEFWHKLALLYHRNGQIQEF